jgi:hypothetical protein
MFPPCLFNKPLNVSGFVHVPYFHYRSNKLAAQPSKYETMSRKGPKMALGGTDAVIMLRKRVFKHITEIPNDPVEYRLLYAEAVQQVISVSTDKQRLKVHNLSIYYTHEQLCDMHSCILLRFQKNNSAKLFCFLLFKLSNLLKKSWICTLEIQTSNLKQLFGWNGDLYLYASQCLDVFIAF